MRNLYQLYADNDWKAGFLVRRATWGNTYALVKSVGGKTEGKLSGWGPYWFDRGVVADVFGTWHGQDMALPCPGCYQWYVIEHPEQRMELPKRPVLPRAKISDEQRKKIAELLGLDG